MKMYKLHKSGNSYSIQDKIDGKGIPVDPDNMDYQRFIDDIYEKGVEIVEGADYVGVVSYTDARRAEYPSLEDQLDKIYHSGVNAWKADIKKIKDKYPKQTMDATELQKRKDDAIFNLQKRNYEKASARLAQYELSAGVKGVVKTEKIWDGITNSYVDKDVIGFIVEPLPLFVEGIGRNPLIVQDEKERGEAWEVINNTPQAVIDSINT